MNTTTLDWETLIIKVYNGESDRNEMGLTKIYLKRDIYFVSHNSFWISSCNPIKNMPAFQKICTKT
jgi:hypothetical protein